MTEPKRWLALDRRDPRRTGLPTVEVVAAAEFDRLRDERDSLSTLYVAARDSEAELARVAAVLADALRNAPCYCDHPLRAGLPPCSRCSALAVFDTLTENEPCGHSRECNRRFAAGWGQRSKTDPLCTCDTLTEEKTDA